MLNLPLLCGYLADKLLGDPARLPHPVVWFGRWISFWEHRLNHGRWRMFKGAALAIVSTTLVFAITWSAFHFYTCPAMAIAGMVAQGILIFYCLAGTTLIREVRMVFQATELSLEQGRRQVGRIVGRNTEELTREEIHTAALETLAENLSDGVIAPLFWLAVLGVPGMLAYKMVNTLDSMIGYHSERYLRFGCWAARIDDVANWIPARLTALLMILVSHLPHRGPPAQMSLWQQLRFVFHYGPQHASPNSGWPEAALASTLDCRFGGPHYYFGEYFPKPYIGNHQRTFTLADMHCACALNLYAEVLVILILIIASILAS